MATTVQSIIDIMESWAPLDLAESWDNPGLMVGNRQALVTGILTTLDVTPEAIQAAKDTGSNLIISHHPMIFKGIKQVDYSNPLSLMLADLIKHDIAVYSAHTNLDITPGGLNDMLADRIGLLQVEGFIPTSVGENYKIIVYVPTSHANQVRKALADAGSGYIGNYSACSFSVTGRGRFCPEEGTHPFIGKTGSLEIVEEERIETIIPKKDLRKTVAAMIAAHPYEEVGYDVFPMIEPNQQYSLGRVGQLQDAMSFDDFSEYLQEALPLANLRFGGLKKNRVQTIALCSGGGAEFIPQAAKLGVDLYITGDVKYHDMQRARELGLMVVDAGHFGTEEMVAAGIADYLSQNLENADIIHVHDGQEDFFF